MVQSPQRVFILCRESLFGQGVKNLVERQPEMIVVGCEQDLESARTRIEALKPDVILVQCNEPRCELAAFGSQAPAMAELMRLAPQAGIVILNLETNRVCLFRKEERAVNQVEDLMQLIHSSARPILGGESICN